MLLVSVYQKCSCNEYQFNYLHEHHRPKNQVHLLCSLDGGREKSESRLFSNVRPRHLRMITIARFDSDRIGKSISHEASRRISSNILMSSSTLARPLSQRKLAILSIVLLLKKGPIPCWQYISNNVAIYIVSRRN